MNNLQIPVHYRIAYKAEAILKQLGITFRIDLKPQSAHNCCTFNIEADENDHETVKQFLKEVTSGTTLRNTVEDIQAREIITFKEECSRLQKDKEMMLDGIEVFFTAIFGYLQEQQQKRQARIDTILAKAPVSIRFSQWKRRKKASKK